MDLCNRNDIQALLQRHGFHFSKAMGQNFLIEGWVPRDIAAASGADEHTGVLEIGPGIGPLTRELARRAGKVVSVELDRRLWPVLEETMAGCENFTLVQGDVMQQDLAALVGEHFGGLRPILCANLPYNITTPLLTRVVESRCFDSVTVLIQKEVAQRICAAPGTADYGAFSLLMQYYTAPELVFEVSNTCFLPAPKVTSAVIHCPARREPPVQVCSEAMLWRTVRAGFALRRKTLVNSLQTGFPLPKDQLAAIVTGCGLPENVRGVIADCPYTSAKDIICSVGRDSVVPMELLYPFVRLSAKLFGRADLTQADALSAVKSARVQILLIHGEDDRFVPCDMSRAIAAANPEKIEFHTFPGAGHGLSCLVDMPRYEALVKAFAARTIFAKEEKREEP